MNQNQNLIKFNQMEVLTEILYGKHESVKFWIQS